MDESQCRYFYLISVGWFIGEQGYENFRFMTVALHLDPIASLDQSQGNAILCTFFLNSNELRGTWNILYSELQLERK